MKTDFGYHIIKVEDRREEIPEDFEEEKATHREEYIEHILQMRKFHDQVKEKYADLAADPRVAEAIKEYNEGSGKTCELGPSAGFTSNGRRLQKLEESVLSESITIRQGAGDLWYVPVMFNGKHTQEISIDTGSTVIALPWALAEKMGITPSSEDATMQLQLADGRVIEAKQIYIESVRVGKFTVENVEAAVLSKEAIKAEPLLGLSFLEHFSYKIDTGKPKQIGFETLLEAVNG